MGAMHGMCAGFQGAPLEQTETVSVTGMGASGVGAMHGMCASFQGAPPEQTETVSVTGMGASTDRLKLFHVQLPPAHLSRFPPFSDQIESIV